MTGTSTADQSFLLITVSTAGAPATLRTHVWRKLRGLGALYLQQSVCLLPDRPAARRALIQLRDRVERDGGMTRLIPMTISDPTQAAAVRAEMSAARDIEYQEVLDRAPTLLAELAHERARANVTFEEVEESEADLTRFRSWLDRIAARDYFGAPLGAAARAAVEECAHALAAFEADAVARDFGLAGTEPSQVAATTRRAGRRLAVAPNEAAAEDPA